MGINLLKNGLLTVFLLFLSGCRDKNDKSRYKHSYKVCDNLYIEMYTVSGGGAYGGDMVSDYFTDSLSFKKFIGLHDSANEVIIYSCDKDKNLCREIIRRWERKKSSEKRFS